MSEILKAIILGIVQGLTEFLPVSSSGHLEIAKYILNDQSLAEQSMLMTVLLHGATALSTIIIFRKDIIEILKGLFQFEVNEEFIFSLKIILSMVPAAIIGLVFKEEIEALFDQQLLLVGLMLIVTGIILFFADRAKDTTKSVGFWNALIIGIAQAIAILPGISRSGATISTSVLLGIDRGKAARFSFLMVVPLILGAMILDTKKQIELNQFSELSTTERVDFAFNELVSDGLLTNEHAQFVKPILLEKEEKWEKLDATIAPDAALAIYNREKELYFNKLASVTTEDRAIEIRKNEFASYRPFGDTNYWALLAGFIAAFLTGLVACTWMIKIVKNSKLTYFSIYCFIVAAIAIAKSLGLF